MADIEYSDIDELTIEADDRKETLFMVIIVTVFFCVLLVLFLLVIAIR